MMRSRTTLANTDAAATDAHLASPSTIGRITPSNASLPNGAGTDDSASGPPGSDHEVPDATAPVGVRSYATASGTNGWDDTESHHMDSGDMESDHLGSASMI